jgi:protein-L-isoaspartate(D-aspartate) O-methyltransferase
MGMSRRVAILFVLVAALAPSWDQDPYKAERETMVREHIEARGITDSAVLRAMRATLRHEFVPDQLKLYAYIDQPLPIGHDQTISQPYIVAFMGDTLDLSKGHRVPEIGTGSGYQAAILARWSNTSIRWKSYRSWLLRQPASSPGIQTSPCAMATAKGWPEEAPFDRIMLTGPARASRHCSTSSPGRQSSWPVGRSVLNQELVLVEKARDGTSPSAVLPVRFVPMVPESNKTNSPLVSRGFRFPGTRSTPLCPHQLRS